MAKSETKKAAKLEQGRNLARRLYDYKIIQLDKFGEQERATYLADYPLLNAAEFEDIRRQVIKAKTEEQTRVGWYSIPHDITVLVFVLVTWFTDLQTGAIVAIAAVVLLESIFQVYYNPVLYPPLSLAVWLTYPAYALLAWLLYTRGFAWYWIALAVLGAWGGPFIIGLIARIPMQLFMKAKIEAAKHKAREAAEEEGKKTSVKVQGKS